MYKLSLTVITIVLISTIVIFNLNNEKQSTDLNESHQYAFPNIKHTEDVFLTSTLSSSHQSMINIQKHYLNICLEQGLETCEKAFWSDLAEYWQVDTNTAKSWFAEVKNHEENIKLLEQNTLNINDRFETIWLAHEQAFGKAKAEKIYGRQKALADFNHQTGALWNNMNIESADELIEQWEQITQDTLGKYGQELKEQIGAFKLYQIEIQLRERAAVLVDSEKKKIREKYFSIADAQELMNREIEDSRQAVQVSIYQTKLKILNDRYQNQPNYQNDPIYQQELKNLRIANFSSVP